MKRKELNNNWNFPFQQTYHKRKQKLDKYLNLAKELKKGMELEDDSDTSYIREKLGKETEAKGTRNLRKN